MLAMENQSPASPERLCSFFVVFWWCNWAYIPFLCFLVVDHWLLIKIGIRCGTHLIIRFRVIDVHIPEEGNDFQASRVRPSSSDQFNQLCLFCAKFRFWFKHGTAANCVSLASLFQGAQGTCVTSHKFVQVVLPQSPSKRHKNRSLKFVSVALRTYCI